MAENDYFFKNNSYLCSQRLKPQNCIHYERRIKTWSRKAQNLWKESAVIDFDF